MRKFLSLFLALFSATVLNAQGLSNTGDIFADNLKLYTCVAVLAIILGFIFFFLFRLEGRLSKLEKGN